MLRVVLGRITQAASALWMVRHRGSFVACLLGMALVGALGSLGLFSALPASARSGGAFPAFTWGAAAKGHLLGGFASTDAFAPLVNPAAASRCASNRSPHVAVEQVKPFEVPITAVAVCGPAAGGHLIARQSPVGLGFDYNTYVFGFTKSWTVQGETLAFAFGTTPKLLFVSIADTGIGLDDRAWGHALDMGALLDVELASVLAEDTFSGATDSASLLFSFDARDVLSQIRYGSGTRERAAKPTYGVGAGVRAGGLIVGTKGRFEDGSSRWRIGLQYEWASPYFPTIFGIAMRAGVGRGEASVGLGVDYSGIGIDYAYIIKGEGLDDEGTHALSSRVHF